MIAARTDVVGSLLPPELLKARERLERNDPMQDDAGLAVVTDGEIRS